MNRFMIVSTGRFQTSLPSNAFTSGEFKHFLLMHSIFSYTRHRFAKYLKCAILRNMSMYPYRPTYIQLLQHSLTFIYMCTYSLHPNVFTSSECIQFIRIYSLHQNIFTTSEYIHFVRMYSLHPDVFTSSKCIHFIRIYSRHPNIFTSSECIHFIRMYSLHPNIFTSSECIHFIQMYSLRSRVFTSSPGIQCIAVN